MVPVAGCLPTRLGNPPIGAVHVLARTAFPVARTTRRPAPTMTPDFGVPGRSKTEDAEDQDAEDQDADEPSETEKSEPNDNERRVGNPGVPREAADPAEQERSEDTLRSRHVPGGEWLANVRSFLKDNILLKRENGGRRGEGRDSAEGIGEGSSW
ncbi:hypothetical protein NDU88_002753 [Pleurodeles waltl]|uniref:Uncharacterized protein n=1 Tax=Pleurodeles waltl TaxID=8319 RepID=A0AAV7SDU2_PLEWA|nr:hypothetical protein NDU88_002753 [Pleurodeles waltl]